MNAVAQRSAINTLLQRPVAILIGNQIRGFAVTGRHSKIVAGKKNALDAAKTKLFARLGIKIVMVRAR